MKQCLAILTLSLLINPFLSASGLTFLKLETNARNAAMGGTGTGFYHKPSVVHYNPAGIAGMDFSAVQIMHTQWIQDMTIQHGSGVLSVGRTSIGLAFYNAAITNIEVRTRPGPPESEFTARNFGTGLTVAYSFSPSFRAGITGKLLYEKIFIDEATGYGIDIGFQYLSTTPGLVFGLTILNIGSMNQLRNESTELPLTYRIGSSYELPFSVKDLTIRLAVDGLQYSGDDKIHLMFGGEIGYSETFYTRIGLHSGIQARSLTVGFGIYYGVFELDYAYIPFTDNFGSGHTISFGMRF
jgi:hypothetical protein